jgi:hypothetical protein
MASTKRQFNYSLEIGKQGETVVSQKLANRRHWHSPKNPIIKGAIIINPEYIMCPAQVWTDTTKERKHNKDFTVSVNACSECNYNNCQYKKFEPYPESITDQRHEVKTNKATHNKEPKIGYQFKMIKDFIPTGNLFIEHYCNVSHDKSTKNPGWYKREPLAEWYHFYQPILPTTSDVSKDEKERFMREMTTSDRLIPNTQFGYIISMTGAKLKEIEPILCEKQYNGEPNQAPAYNDDNNSWSMGTMIPVTEILNNPLYFNENQCDILFTPIIEMVSGTKESKADIDTYYLSIAHYDRLPQLKMPETIKEGVKIKRLEIEKFKQTINGNIVWYGNAEFLKRPDNSSKWSRVSLGDGWTVYDPSGNIEYIGEDAIVDGINVRKLILDKNEQFAIEASGQKIYPISDKLEKAYVKRSRPNFESINTKPYVALLKSAKSWG